MFTKQARRAFRDVEIVTEGGVRLILAGAEDGPRLLAPSHGQPASMNFSWRPAPLGSACMPASIG